MMNLRSKKSEFEHFTKLAQEWWAEKGKFKILHDLQPIRIQYIIDQLKPKNINNLKILDLGCGGGLICEPLAKLGGYITGIDFVKQNIEAAKIHAAKNNLKIEYVKKDINKINSKSKYDVIIVFEVLEHLENWPNFIKKIKLNLKNNGTLLISTINRNILSKILAIDIAENILKWIPKNTHDYTKLIKPCELESILIKESFKIKNFTGLFYDPIAKRWKTSENNMRVNFFCCAKLY